MDIFDEHKPQPPTVTGYLAHRSTCWFPGLDLSAVPVPPDSQESRLEKKTFAERNQNKDPLIQLGTGISEGTKTQHAKREQLELQNKINPTRSGHRAKLVMFPRQGAAAAR